MRPTNRTRLDVAFHSNCGQLVSTGRTAPPSVTQTRPLTIPSNARAPPIIYHVTRKRPRLSTKAALPPSHQIAVASR